MNSIKSAREAIKTKDYKTAIEILETLVDGDDVKAMLELAVMYARGRGVKKDYDRAEALYLRAANLGSAEAEFQLGVYHECESSREWFERAAKKGHADAQYELGCIERKAGRMIDALSWFRAAGSQGQHNACDELLKIYANGVAGIAPDKEEWRHWLKKSADSGDIVSMNWMGELLRDEGNLSEAFKYFQRGAKRGWSDALTNLGLAYKNGDGTELDLTKAFECFFDADRRGNVSATYKKSDDIARVNSWNLYLCYKDGIGVEKDLSNAFAHCASAWKLPEAKIALAEMNEHGVGTSQNWRAALKWYSDAAEAGWPGALEKAEEMRLRVAEDETPSDVHLRAREVLRSTLAAEVAAGFPLLKLIPRTSVFHFLDYFDTLEDAQRLLLIEGFAFFGSNYLLVEDIPQNQVPENWQKHQGLGPYYREVYYFKKLPRYRSITNYATLDVSTAQSKIRRQHLPATGSVEAAKSAQLRKQTDLVIPKLFSEDFNQENLPGGNRVYSGKLNGRQATVRVEFTPKTMGQLRYTVQFALTRADGQKIDSQKISLEQLWFQPEQDGWNYLSDENAERSIETLSTVILQLSDIIERVYSL